MLADSVTQMFVRGGAHYSARLTVNPGSAFTLLLINDDVPERWESTFPSPFIASLTEKVGHTKAFSAFVRMLQLALTGAADALDFDIVPRGDDDDDKVYFVVAQKGELDSALFPLPLSRRPFSIDELKVIVREYRKDNLELRRQIDEIHRRGSGVRTPERIAPPAAQWRQMTPRPRRGK
jgi:hypothetical protein